MKRITDWRALPPIGKGRPRKRKPALTVEAWEKRDWSPERWSVTEAGNQAIGLPKITHLVSRTSAGYVCSCELSHVTHHCIHVLAVLAHPTRAEN